MSTREIAYSIIDNLSEKQIEGFIAMFGEYLPNAPKTDRKIAAFRSLESMIESAPDTDYDKELAEYREERYGKMQSGISDYTQHQGFCRKQGHRNRTG